MLTSSCVWLMVAVTYSATASTENNQSLPQVKPEFTFVANDNLQADVEATLASALKQRKLALFVLGAQWCHDSRGLARQFSSSPLNGVIEERFVTQFIDVGYYQDLRWLTEQFGYPGYFATPSVMIVDPATRLLVNRTSMPRWNSADSVSDAEYLQYFATVDTNAHSDAALTQDNREKLLALAKVPTARLFSGFETLGPLLQDAIENDPDDISQLRTLSDEIYTFRIQLQKDINQLYQQALMDPEQAFDLPDYGPFSWEN